MRLKIVIKLVGALLVLQSFFMAGCGCMDFIWYADEGDNAIEALIISAVITFLFGMLCLVLGWEKLDRISRREGIAIVALGWIASALFAAIPFYLTLPILGMSEPHVGITGAIFEATSGITATGATNLNNIEAWPKSLLLWRATTQWLGGLGILVIFVAIMSYMGIGAKSLFRNESSFQTGEVSVARIKDTANVILRIYIFLTIICFLGLWLLGMTAYDAVTHTLATVSTGGFSPKAASLGFYSEWDTGWLIELWVSIFMLICSVSFLVWVVLLKRRWGRLRREEEGKAFFLWCVFLTLIVFLSGCIFEPQVEWHTHLRRAWFNSVSLASTTGFATYDFTLWQPISVFLLLFAMVLGGASGSTTGGFKLSRMIVILRTYMSETIKAFRPNKVEQIKVNGNTINTAAQHQTLVFIGLFVFISLLSLGVVSILEVFNGADALSLVGMVVATISNGGPGIGSVGPSESCFHLTPATKIFLSFLMIVGRLELFTVIVLFVPSLWKKY